MMKAQKLGIFSAVVASFCCLTPLVLLVLGLGSLGIGAVLGRFHWWFLGVALALLTVAWRRYFQERTRCATERCEMVRGTTTRWTLLLASLVVAVFVGLNVYTYANQRIAQTVSLGAHVQGNLTEVVIPVEGMTCLTCALTVESSLKRLPGVVSADANVAQQNVTVHYDPAQVTVDNLITTINQTGYNASRPQGK